MNPSPVMFTSGWRLLPFLACVVALCYGIFRPTPPPEFFAQSDKFLHVCAFAGLAFCARFTFFRSRSVWLWVALLLASVGTEYLQHWVQPTRLFSVYDVMANGLGVMLGLALWAALLRTPLQPYMQPACP